MTFQLPIAVLVATAIQNGSSHSSFIVAAQEKSQQSNSGGGAARRQPVTCPQSPSLHCKNGSECQEGIANFGKKHDHLNLQTHESGYYCKCMEGFIGHECRIQVDDCDGDTGYNPSDPTGTLTSCYHGSQCRSTEGNNGKSFYCDCAKLNRDTEPMAKKYAGMLCQHESTSLCAASLAGENAPNQQFCTNHGKCVKMVTEGDPHPGCVCRDGWVGNHCETWVDPILAFANENPPHGTRSVSGIILFSVFMIAIIATVIGLAVICVKIRKEGNTNVDNAAVAQGKRSTIKSDLDPDGSGTLGKPSENANDDADGHLELAPKGGHPTPVQTLNVENAAPEGTSKAKITMPEELAEPEIV